MSFLKGKRGSILKADGFANVISFARRSGPVPLKKDMGRKSGNSPWTRYPAAALSPPGTPLHWFDFTDTSTLWQDEAATTPATADNDVVMRIDNKGSAATPDGFVSTAAGGPVSEVVGIPATSVGSAVYFDGAETLNTAMETDITTSEHASFCVVIAAETQDGFDYPFSWGGTGGMATIVDNTGKSTMWLESSGFQSSAAFPVDTWYSQIFVSDDEQASQRLQGIHSFVSDDETSTLDKVGSVGVDAEMIFGDVSGGGQTWAGWIGEVIVYNGALTAAEITDLKAYVVAKYGITWTD